MNSAKQDEVVNAHNRFRRQVIPTASNMRIMVSSHIQVKFHIQDSILVYHIQDASIFRTLPYSGRFHIQDGFDFDEGINMIAFFHIILHRLIVESQENNQPQTIFTS